VLAIFAVILWLVAFPAVIGILHGLRLWHGERLWPALGAAALSVAMVIGLATRKPWKRPTQPSLVDRRPLFVRFSTWLYSAILYPNVLMGAILLFRKGPPPDYSATLLLGLLLSTVQTILAWLTSHRRKLGVRS
jgi:hypothetical protein